MIIKTYEIDKINFEINNFILFYGQNEGFKKEEIEKIRLKNKINGEEFSFFSQFKKK